MHMIVGWKRRHELFSKFSEGIQFDKEGFETAKSEAVANFVATLLPGTVFDAFTGIGGSAIAFARAGKEVISVEIVPERSAFAQHNAEVYDVADRIKFVAGDTLRFWNKFDFDSAYFDPPWGGVGYEEQKALFFASFKPNILPVVKKLIAHGKNVAITVPLNFDFNELKLVSEDVRIYFNDQYGKPYCTHCVWLADKT